MENKYHTILKRFHKDVATLKAHQWKHFFDLYWGCSHNCAYCLYRQDENFGRCMPIPGVTADQLAVELDNVKPAGITYLGATSDIYQPMEKELQLVRPILEVFCKKQLPIILATKSLLIRRDIDLLSRLATDGLVEVSITMITLDESFAKLLEPGAPSPSERLELTRELTSSGIPVSFHVSPFIPGYFSDADLCKFVCALRETKATGAYSCILGMRRAYKDTLVKKIGAADQALARYFVEIYNEPKTPRAVSPLAHVVLAEMERFSQICHECGFEFYCEHLPYLDTNTRVGGIFRFKLPTIGDIYRHFIKLDKQEVRLNDLEDYLVDFPAVDEAYRSLVVNLWQAGALFQDTRFAAIGTKPCEKYILTDSVQLAVSEVMTCD